MIDFTIGIAGREAGVRAMFDSTRDFCAEYLCDAEPDLFVESGAEDLRKERERSARADQLEGRSVRTIPDAYLELLAVQRKLAEALFAFDTLLFHGSVVAVDGEGYLFAAKSGTGKSTHARLWREMLGERAVMINDDKPFLRMEGGRVFAYGSPWNGKHRLGTNGCAPLKAICILERGEVNEIHPISKAEALPVLMQQTHRPSDKANFPKFMELMGKLTEGTAFYRLKCNMEKDAAKASYEGMKGMPI